MTGTDPLDQGYEDKADPFASGGGLPGDETFEAATVSEEDLSLPPAGKEFIGQIIGIVNSISKTSGNPMFVWEVRIVSDLSGDMTYTGFLPKPMYTVKSSSAAWKMDAVCNALGLVAGDDGRYSFTRDDVMGVMFVMELDEDEYKGQTQRTVGTMSAHPRGAGHKEPITGDLLGEPGRADDVPF